MSTRPPRTAGVPPALPFKWFAAKHVVILAAFAVLSLPVAIANAAEEAQPIGVSAPMQSCAASGKQILADNIVRAAVYQEQFSHYSPQRGRCYVEMQVEIMASDEDADRFGRFLYDGDTKEMLAFAKIEGGKKSGRVFDLDHRTTTFANSGWDDASAYIHAMMAGE